MARAFGSLGDAVGRLGLLSRSTFVVRERNHRGAESGRQRCGLCLEKKFVKKFLRGLKGGFRDSGFGLRQNGEQRLAWLTRGGEEHAGSMGRWGDERRGLDRRGTAGTESDG